MARLILFLMLFGALAFAVAAAVLAFRTLAAPAVLPADKEDKMPHAMRNVAYAVLLLLLLGLTSGWLGPA